MSDSNKRKYSSIQVEVTSRCNLCCRTCMYAYFGHCWDARDMSDRVLDRVLEAAPQCGAMHLQGWGESLLRDDCVGMVQRVKKAGCQVSLSSNGTIMTERLAKDLIDAGLDSMAFSFAGPDRPTQDGLRGSGTFDAATQSVSTFVKVRGARKAPKVLLNYLLTPENASRLPAAVSLCAALGADLLVARHMVHAVAAEQAEMISYNLAKEFRWSQLLARLKASRHGKQLILRPMKDILAPVCDKNPLESFFVGADGSVSPCVYLNPPVSGMFCRIFRGKEHVSDRVIMGNLNDASIDEIWNSDRFRAFRELFQRRLEVHEKLLAGVTPDFGGMQRLNDATAKLRECFEESLQAPEPCRVCPHLFGL